MNEFWNSIPAFYLYSTTFRTEAILHIRTIESPCPERLRKPINFVSMKRWYISHRPDDKGFVGRMRVHLQELVPGLEVKQSDPRVNSSTIGSIIEEMDTVLVVIGPNWLRQVKQALPFLDSPGDHVRHELTAALQYSHILIAPLLLDGVKMPGKAALPPGLSAFSKINATTIRHTAFESDLLTVVEMLRTPGEESSWAPTVEYGTIQISGKQGGFILRYLETEYAPVTIMIDGEEVGAMHLLNKTFEQKVKPGEHLVTLRSEDKPVKRCECRVLVRQGQTSLLYAERNWFIGTMSLTPVN
jgi:hypothetical protein